MKPYFLHKCNFKESGFYMFYDDERIPMCSFSSFRYVIGQVKKQGVVFG